MPGSVASQKGGQIELHVGSDCQKAGDDDDVRPAGELPPPFHQGRLGQEGAVDLSGCAPASSHHARQVVERGC